MTPIGYAYESLLVLEFNDPLGARPYTINGSVSSSLKHPSTSISGGYRLLCCTRDWENEEEAARGCFGGGDVGCVSEPAKGLRCNIRSSV